MLRRFRTGFIVLSMTLDAGLTFLSLLFAVMIRPSLRYLPILRLLAEVDFPVVLYFIGPILWVVIFLLSPVYDPLRTRKAVDEFSNVVVASGFAALCFAGFLYLTFRYVSRWLFITFVILNLCLLMAWRVIARLALHIWKPPQTMCRVLIVGTGEVGQQVAQMVLEYAWTGLELVGYLEDGLSKVRDDQLVLGALADVEQVVQRLGVDEVVIALPRQAQEQLNELVATLHCLPVHVRVVPDYFTLALYRATVDDFAGIPMIDLRAPALNDFQRLLKRLFDILVGGILALLALPVMGIVAVAIKLDSPGPVIFRQNRVGENGVLFTMFKFRSMVVRAEDLQEHVNEVDDEGQVIHKHTDDPRVTRVGRFIRRLSIDELPQLFNVLKGDMSLVGPRPELPWLVDKYDLWQRKRFAVPQGITGWWQVNGRSDRPMHLHTEDDLYYIQHYSLFLDLLILWRTIWAVVRGTGAY